MFKFIASSVITVAMALGASVAQAEELSKCQTISAAAEKVMEHRQNGVPMTRLTEGAEDNKLFMYMVEEAYRTTRYATHEYQQREVTEMGNRWYLACLEANR